MVLEAESVAKYTRRMQRMLLHLISWLFLAAGLYGAYYSYCIHEGNNKANRSLTLLGESKLQDAISEANRAIKLIPDDALGYYVRGTARLRQIAEQQTEDSLEECKKDLERAISTTRNNELKANAEWFLSIIEKLEAVRNSS